jgi:hypothetical protein
MLNSATRPDDFANVRAPVSTIFVSRLHNSRWQDVIVRHSLQGDRPVSFCLEAVASMTDSGGSAEVKMRKPKAKRSVRQVKDDLNDEDDAVRCVRVLLTAFAPR